jgi:uncharacterized membrane protein YoaK (UPF0700 family)
MSTWTHAADNWLPWSLAFVGGFGDAAGFVLAKSFTGHITGNFVLAAVSAAALEWRAALVPLSAVVSFLAGVALSLALARSLSLRQPSVSLLSSAMGVEVILIVASYWALARHYSAGPEIFVVLLSLALGVQNGAVRRAGSLSVHTTYLTGMITGLLVADAERLGNRNSAAASVADPRAGMVRGLAVLFFLGAATGAALIYRFNAAGILWILPVLVVIAVAGTRCASRLQPAS